MQTKFESFVKKLDLFNKTDNMLVALSGGVDSVVLCELLKNGGYKFTLAHCNFSLRGKESDNDEKFCKKLAEKSGVAIHTTRFETKLYSEKNGLSVQMAARELRYKWFASLIKENKYSRLLTAHHASDNTETVLINLLRGTGINGLKGIQPENKNIVRPLLCFTKEEILRFAGKNKLKFREDSSNQEDKYERNYLRLKVIPRLKKIRPDIDELFSQNSKRFAEESEIIKQYIDERINDLVIKRNETISVNRSELGKEKFQSSILHYLLLPYGFSETQRENLLQNVIKKSISGKRYLSSDYELNLERDNIVIAPAVKNVAVSHEISQYDDLKQYFSVSKVTKPEKLTSDQIILERNKIIFPMVVRRAVTGDKFQPFGMKGFKLISDFFRDKKFSALEKKQCRLLVNGNGEIIWVIGHRSDERYRVDPSATDILILEAIEGN